MYQEESYESNDDEDYDSDQEAKQNQEQKQNNNKEQKKKYYIYKQDAMENKLKILLEKKKQKYKDQSLVNEIAITSSQKVEIEDINVNDDIQREVQFYNIAFGNMENALKQLEKAHIQIDRPDDYFVEMLKNDTVMQKVKNKLIHQQIKIQNFEEKKQRLENKKFAKQLKMKQQNQQHSEKKKNLDAIQKWKQEIRSKGDKARDLSEFIMKDKKDKQRGGGGGGGRGEKNRRPQQFLNQKSKKIGKVKGQGGFGTQRKKKGLSKRRPGKIKRQMLRKKKNSRKRK